MTQTLKIKYINYEGDGIAVTPSGLQAIPFTLPEEVVCLDNLNGKESQITLLEKSSSRVDPFCKYFGNCGGCRLQHWTKDAYVQWKRQLVVEALKFENIHASVAQLVEGFSDKRRRVIWHASKRNGKISVGFYKRSSHIIVPIDYCSISKPGFIQEMPLFYEITATFLKENDFVKLHTTLLDQGLDLSLTYKNSLTSDQLKQLIFVAVSRKILRLSLNGELLYQANKPSFFVGDVLVNLPLSPFLQVTESAENFMAELAKNWLKPQKKVIDLFCGIGTFSLRLAKNSCVTAVDCDPLALGSLQKAAHSSGNLKPIVTEKRNLFKRPFLVKELNKFSGLIFDPPRSGAPKQASQIANSKIERVVAVSCSPKTFAQDLSILVKGGYKIDSIIPIDQFLWSPHVEIVGLLSKVKPGHQLKL